MQETKMRFTCYKRISGIFQRRSLKELDEKDIRSMQEKKNVFWLDILNPTATEIFQLSELFGIHPLTAEDMQTRDGREKCEKYSRYFFFCINTLNPITKGSKEQVLDVESPTLYMIMFDDCILTVHYEEMIHRLSVIFKRLEIGLGSGRVRVLGPGTENGFTSAWIMYCLFDDVVDEFIPQMKRIETEVDSIEDLVILLSKVDHKEMLKRIGYSKKRISTLMRLLKPKRDIIAFLLTRCPERMCEIELYIRDIQDHIYTMLNELEHDIETMNMCHLSYLALISMEMTEFSNEMAVVSKKMNVLATMFLPLTIITGMWGMNVPVPGQQGTEMKDYFQFMVICAFMCLTAYVFYLIALRKK